MGSPEARPGDEGARDGRRRDPGSGARARAARGLHDLIDEAGHSGAARQLGVDRKTLWRVLNAGRLTPRLTRALERRGANPEAARRRSRLDALERRTEVIDEDLEALHEATESLREEFRTLGGVQAEALRARERRLSRVESQQPSQAAPASEPPGAGHDGGDDARASLRVPCRA